MTTNSPAILATTSVTGGERGDILISSQGNNTVNGDVGCDVLFGNQGNNELDGGEGNDSISAVKWIQQCSPVFF
jgi:Ca2+-binding RTX toxin-like protein